MVLIQRDGVREEDWVHQEELSLSLSLFNAQTFTGNLAKMQGMYSHLYVEEQSQYSDILMSDFQPPELSGWVG